MSCFGSVTYCWGKQTVRSNPALRNNRGESPRGRQRAPQPGLLTSPQHCSPALSTAKVSAFSPRALKGGRESAEGRTCTLVEKKEKKMREMEYMCCARMTC